MPRLIAKTVIRLQPPAFCQSPVISWLQAEGSSSSKLQIVYRGKLSGPDLWLHYGCDGWQGPTREVKLVLVEPGLTVAELPDLDGHLSLECAVTDGQQWDNNSGADYRRFPTVPFILYHTYLGPPEGRWRAARHVREQSNLFLETSWCRWRTILQLVEEVGPDRVLFGSDAPVDGPRHYCHQPPNVEGQETYNGGLISLIRALGPKSARKVMGDNARRLFRLNGNSHSY